MTHAVVWIDHKEARIFQSILRRRTKRRFLRRNTISTRIRKDVGRQENTRTMRIDTSAKSREHSTASMPS